MVNKEDYKNEESRQDGNRLVYTKDSWEKVKKSTTYRASANIAFFQFPESITIRIRLVYLPQGDIHEVIAVDKMTVQGFPILQLDKLTL